MLYSVEEALAVNDTFVRDAGDPTQSVSRAAQP